MIKVFIIDDSMLIRNSIKKLLSNTDSITIIGEASNPVDAMIEFKKVGLPDVFILDIEMPKMDGISFLKKLKEQRPIPTIVFSSVVSGDSSKAIEAMSLGACDVISKPYNIIQLDIGEFKDEFIAKIKAASKSKHMEKLKPSTNNTPSTNNSSNKIIAIGASTGGVQTIEEIIVNLNKNHPPILITQHMPAGFTSSFAKRLNKVSKVSTIKEVQGEEVIESSTIYIAPGNLHLEIQSIGQNRFKTVLKDYPKVSNHKPSVDVLFTSFAKEVKHNSVAFLLTGMGRDGALGIKKIKDIGGATYGQDEKSSIVYGMPKAAFEIGGLNEQLSLIKIIEKINNIG
jgi:two-component system chemotaxis response regulator CheB